MLRNDLFDFNEIYIVVTGKISVTNLNNNAYDKKLSLKNNAPFFSCVLKVNNMLIDYAEDLDFVMPMYSLLKYSKNYQKITGSLWNYYRDEANSGYKNENRDRIHYSIKDSESFNYKTSIIRQLKNSADELENIKVVVPLKYLSNFLRELKTPLINCEVSLNLKWSKNCVLTSKATRNIIAAQGDQPLVNAINSPTNAVLDVTDCKLYIPVVTLSVKNDNKLYEQLKEGFRITVKWLKYICQISNQTANNNLNYLIDPTFSKVNRLFVLAFPNKEYRSSFT